MEGAIHATIAAVMIMITMPTLIPYTTSAQPVNNNATLGGAGSSLSANERPSITVVKATDETIGANDTIYNFTYTLLDKPPVFSEEDRALMERGVENVDVDIPPVPEGKGPLVGPIPGTETTSTDTIDRNNTNITSPTPVSNTNLLDKPTFRLVGAGDFQSFASREVMTMPVVGQPQLHSSIWATAEPAVASDGSTVFYVVNKFGARSTDSGNTWQYVDVTQDGFDTCCDQDVIYSPVAHKFIWYRQGNTGQISVGVSADALHWTFFNRWSRTFAQPVQQLTSDQQVRLATAPFGCSNCYNVWFDYPQLALTNRHLFVGVSVALGCGTGCNLVLGSMMLRYNLADLSRGQPGAIFAQYDRDAGSNYAPVQGASDTMYWATHISTSEMRIYRWPDSSLLDVERTNQGIDRWDNSGRFSCIMNRVSSGNIRDSNWCGQSQNKITNGWLFNGKIGFFWNVAQGNSFRWPYVDAATFDTRDLHHISGQAGRPYIFNQNYAWQSAYASPNGEGLGLSAWMGGGNIYPSVKAGIDDRFNGDPPGWEMHVIREGRGYPAGNRLGDYLRVRPFFGPAPNLWIASAYIVFGENGTPLPYYFIFGREADTPSFPVNLKIPVMPVSPIGPRQVSLDTK